MNLAVGVRFSVDLVLQSISKTVFDSGQQTAGQTRKLFATAVLLTVLVDVAIVSIAALILPALNLNDAHHVSMMRLLGFLLVVYLGVGFYVGAFDPASFRGRRLYMGRASQALCLSFALTFMAFFSLKVSLDFSRLLVTLLAVIAIPGVAMGRLLIYRRVVELIERGAPAEVVIVDGVDDVKIQGMLTIEAASSGISTDLANLENVSRLAALGNSVERIVVICSPERRQAWAQLLKCLAVRSEIRIPELDELRPLSLSVEGPGIGLVVSQHPLKWQQAAIKRFFDIVVSATMLLALSPIMIATAIAIRLESPGAALFRQKRLGFGNRNFVMFKFRSMRNDSADYDANMLTQRNDPRVTRIGGFIRRTSIDELPQLINVLIGDMSMVGPRPHAPAALAGDKLYWEVDENYWHRHIAKPGITGLAQVRGLRGNTFEEDDLQSRLDADLEYVSNWSLTRDVEIMLATFHVVTHDKAF